MPEPVADFYLIVHVWTTTDEHGVCVSKDSAEVIEVAWILLNSRTLEEVYCNESILIVGASRGSACPTRQYSDHLAMQYVPFGARVTC
jgi:hypothetical protein